MCYFIKFVTHILSTHHVIIYTTDCVQKMLINSNNCLQPAWQSCPCFGEWHADGCANGKAGVHMGRRLYLFYACVRSSRIILWRISPNSPRSFISIINQLSSKMSYFIILVCFFITFEARLFLLYTCIAWFVVFIFSLYDHYILWHLHYLIDWRLTPTLAVFQLYCVVDTQSKRYISLIVWHKIKIVVWCQAEIVVIQLCVVQYQNDLTYPLQEVN